MDRRNCDGLVNYLVDIDILMTLLKQETQWTCKKRDICIDIMAKEIIVGVT